VAARLPTRGVTGGAWVHAPPRNPENVGRSVMASSPLRACLGTRLRRRSQKI